MIPRNLSSGILLAMLAACSSAPPKQATAACIVVAVADGDTLSVHCGTRVEQPAQTVIVRLAEIDTPEKGQAFGERSRQALSALCLQKLVSVEPQTRDRYGRTIARITCDGTDASAHMVRVGMAWAFTKYLTDPQVKVIEIEARGEQRGLWADAEPVPPWEWRTAKTERR